MTRLRIFVAQLVLTLAEWILRVISGCRPPFWRSAFGMLFAIRTHSQRAAESKLAYGMSCKGKSDLRLLLVVPFFDDWSRVEQCLKSLSEQEFEEGMVCRIMLVHNGSVAEETVTRVKHFFSITGKTNLDFGIAANETAFSWGALCNTAVNEGRSFAADVFVFLDFRLEIRTRDGVQRLARFVSNTENAGAIGTAIVDSNDCVQHIFLCPGVKVVGVCLGRGERFNRQHPWCAAPRAVPAVASAFSAVRASDFMTVGGFDEVFSGRGGDVDLCFRLEKEGRQNWVLPFVVGMQNEAGLILGEGNRPEVISLYKKWGSHLTEHPQVSTILSRWCEKPTLALGEGRYPWWWVV